MGERKAIGEITLGRGLVRSGKSDPPQADHQEERDRQQ